MIKMAYHESQSATNGFWLGYTYPLGDADIQPLATAVTSDEHLIALSKPTLSCTLGLFSTSFILSERYRNITQEM
jgi:hypothetical protein